LEVAMADAFQGTGFLQRSAEVAGDGQHTEKGMRRRDPRLCWSRGWGWIYAAPSMVIRERNALLSAEE